MATNIVSSFYLSLSLSLYLHILCSHWTLTPAHLQHPQNRFVTNISNNRFFFSTSMKTNFTRMTAIIHWNVVRHAVDVKTVNAHISWQESFQTDEQASINECQNNACIAYLFQCAHRFLSSLRSVRLSSSYVTFTMLCLMMPLYSSQRSYRIYC